MMWNAAIEDGSATHYSRSFNFTPKDKFDQVIEELTTLGFRLVQDKLVGGWDLGPKSSNFFRSSDGHQILVFKYELTFVTIDPARDGGNCMGVSVESHDKELVEKLTTIFNYKRPNAGTLSLIKNDGCGSFSFKEIGKAGLPLVQENYRPADIESFKFIVKGLTDTNPHGRLVIIDGKPGTGKTYYLKGILNELNLPTYYYLTPGQVAELASPQLLELWFSINCKPIVVIIEDADECLVPRRGDNIIAIQSLLNLTDGMIGQALDLRVICTTNAKRVEIDEALLRSGRLLKHVTLEALELEHADRVFQRLNPSAGSLKPKSTDEKIGFKTSASEKVTIADVYQAAWEATS
jgi:hypothetical protein